MGLLLFGCAAALVLFSGLLCLFLIVEFIISHICRRARGIGDV